MLKLLLSSGKLGALTAELLHQLGYPALKSSDNRQGRGSSCNMAEKKNSESENEINRLGISRITCQLGDLCGLLVHLELSGGKDSQADGIRLEQSLKNLAFFLGGSLCIERE